MAEFQQVSTHEDAPPPPEGTKEHEQAMVQLAEEAGAVEREDEQPACFQINLKVLKLWQKLTMN